MHLLNAHDIRLLRFPIEVSPLGQLQIPYGVEKRPRIPAEDLEIRVPSQRKRRRDARSTTDRLGRSHELW